MKYIFLIVTILIILPCCDDENPVAPKNITNTDSLYISHVIPESGIPSQLIQIYGKGFGSDTSKVNVFFGDSVIYATFLSDSLIKINVPNFVAGKFKISVKVHDSITYSPIDFEIISINNKFSKIEVWFKNFIFENTTDKSWYYYPYTDGREKTIDTNISSLDFSLDLKRFDVHDFSEGNNIHYFQVLLTLYNHIKFIIDDENLLLNNFIIEHRNPKTADANTYDGYKINIEKIYFIKDDKGNFLSEMKVEKVRQINFEALKEYHEYRGDGNERYTTDIVNKIIGVTDSSEISIKLTILK